MAKVPEQHQMDTRDNIAMVFMIGILASGNTTVPDIAAARAYTAANEFLKEREKILKEESESKDNGKT